MEEHGTKDQVEGPHNEWRWVIKAGSKKGRMSLESKGVDDALEVYAQLTWSTIGNRVLY